MPLTPDSNRQETSFSVSLAADRSNLLANARRALQGNLHLGEWKRLAGSLAVEEGPWKRLLAAPSLKGLVLSWLWVFFLLLKWLLHAMYF